MWHNANITMIALTDRHIMSNDVEAISRTDVSKSPKTTTSLRTLHDNTGSLFHANNNRFKIQGNMKLCVGSNITADYNKSCK